MVPRAVYFYGLNAVRFLSVVSLLLVFASSIFVMVSDVRAYNNFEDGGGSSNSTDTNCEYIEDSTVPNQPAGVFWAVVNRFFIIFQVIFLILSEASWPLPFFDRFFPVLGSNFGLGPLGIIQALIGAAVLSHHVDDFTLVAAFFLFALGCVNILLGLIFREEAKAKRSIRAWRHGNDAILPPPASTLQNQMTGTTTVSYSQQPKYEDNNGRGGGGMSAAKKFRQSLFGGRKADPLEFGVQPATERERADFGFGRQGETKAGLKGFLLSRPVESLPRYAARPSSTSGQVAAEPEYETRPSTPPRGAPIFRSSPTVL